MAGTIMIGTHVLGRDQMATSQRDGEWPHLLLCKNHLSGTHQGLIRSTSVLAEVNAYRHLTNPPPTAPICNDPILLGIKLPWGIGTLDPIQIMALFLERRGEDARSVQSGCLGWKEQKTDTGKETGILQPKLQNFGRRNIHLPNSNILQTDGKYSRVFVIIFVVAGWLV